MGGIDDVVPGSHGGRCVVGGRQCEDEDGASYPVSMDGVDCG